MPFWRRRSEPVARLPSPLHEITERTPHRFRIRLAEAHVEQALEALAPLSERRELEPTVVPAGDPAGAALDLASTFSPRTAAILRPLNTLHRAGVPVTGFEALDLVTELDDAALADAVAGWDTGRNQGPHRHRLEVLAGADILERCLERFAAGGPEARSWRFAAGCVAFNTQGTEARMLEAALEAKADDAPALIDPVINRAEVARLGGWTVPVPEGPLAELIRRRTYVAERAATLAWNLPAPLPAILTDALCEAALRGGEASEPAIIALTRAAPTDRLHDTVARLLESDEPNAMAGALGVLATHWPDEARPVWQRFLESRSVPLRWAAEQTLGGHGTEDDVPDAAAALRKIARAKSSVHMSPPRGAEIVELLLRHRSHAQARVALDDLSARWDRLSDDLREWIEREHPELHPARWSADAATPPSPPDAEPAESLVWPPPHVEPDPDGDGLLLSFDEGAAHSTARDRFEELAEASAAIEVLDGDREWLRVRVEAGDPDALVSDLWDEASRDR